MQTQNSKLEERVAELLGTLEEVSQARVHQAQQLADARLKHSSAKTQTMIANSQEKADIERLQGELKTIQQQLEDAKHRETEVNLIAK